MGIAAPNIDHTPVSALARFFSSAILTELARKGKSPLLIKLAAEASIVERARALGKVFELFEMAFDVLKKKANRHEYIYKAALTQRILLGTHSLQTASMLTEFRTGKHKADMVILNGTGTAYEIKSERDSLTRLGPQIEAYRKVFAKAYVIAGENHIDSVLKIVPQDIGIMVLSTRHQISTLREAQDRPERTCPEAIFDCLRTAEAKELLCLVDVEVPNVPNTQIHSAMRTLFAKLEPVSTHTAMITVLKKTRTLTPLAELLENIPPALHTVVLSTPIRKVDRPKLVQALNTDIQTALTWS